MTHKYDPLGFPGTKGGEDQQLNLTIIAGGCIKSITFEIFKLGYYFPILKLFILDGFFFNLIIFFVVG